MALDHFSSPNLPIAPKTYDQGYFNQLIRSIGSFFKVIDSKAGITTDSLTGKTLYTPTNALTLANGSNDDVQIPISTFLRVEGPTGAFGITGLKVGVAPSDPQTHLRAIDGWQLTIYNPTAYAMTIYNENGSSIAENRILTNTGTDLVTTGAGAVSMIYSIYDSRWIVTSFQG